MKIKLTADLPIHKKHECFVGKEFTVTKKKGRRDALYYFFDKNGIECAAYARELKIIEGSDSDIKNIEDVSDFAK